MPKKIELEKLGNAIRVYADKDERSYNELALHAGLGGSSRLVNIMDGKVNISVVTLFDIAGTLGIPMEKLFETYNEF